MTVKLPKEDLRSLSVNRLPKDLVVKFKTLATRLECTIEDLMVLTLQDALVKGDRFNIDVHRLRNARKLEAKQKEAVEQQLTRILPKVEAADAAD